jgi:hypothetical protein
MYVTKLGTLILRLNVHVTKLGTVIQKCTRYVTKLGSLILRLNVNVTKLGTVIQKCTRYVTKVSKSTLWRNTYVRKSGSLHLPRGNTMFKPRVLYDCTCLSFQTDSQQMTLLLLHDSLTLGLWVQVLLRVWLCLCFLCVDTCLGTGGFFFKYSQADVRAVTFCPLCLISNLMHKFLFIYI